MGDLYCIICCGRVCVQLHNMKCFPNPEPDARLIDHDHPGRSPFLWLSWQTMYDS